MRQLLLKQLWLCPRLCLRLRMLLSLRCVSARKATATAMGTRRQQRQQQRLQAAPALQAMRRLKRLHLRMQRVQLQMQMSVHHRRAMSRRRLPLLCLLR